MPLAYAFALNMVSELRRPLFPGFGAHAASALLRHDWPGNVRELKNTVERSVYRTEDPDKQIRSIVFESSVFAEAFFVRSVKMPLFSGLDNIQLLFQEGKDFAMVGDMSLSLLSLLDLGQFFGSLGLWSGLIVCGLFTTAAIYVRRYRDDS